MTSPSDTRPASPQQDTPPPDSLSDGSLPFGPLYYLIDRREIVFLADLLETYEYLGVLRTVDPQRAVVEILYAPDFYEDAVAVMDALSGEIPSLSRIDSL